MTAQAAPFKHKWAFVLLWTNGGVAFIELIVFWHGPALTTRELLQSVAFTVIFANITSMLAASILGLLIEKASARKVSPLKVGIPGILVFTAGACLVAQSLLAAARVSEAHHFWREYFHTLRVALPLALVFGLGAMTYGMLLGRVQTMERELNEKQIAEERSRKLAAEARLRSLESWIHPHFLFNTLNSISALIPVDPKQAEQTVGRLATLLRSSLDMSEQSLVPLRQEIAMVESYVEIERVRLGSKLRGRIDVPAEIGDAMVPPVSIQCLVENAIKHGIVPQVAGGEFQVSASTNADGSLHVAVRDSGPGFSLSSIRAGHGLDKLAQRLDALFGERARLNISRQGEYSLVEMVLPRV